MTDADIIDSFFRGTEKFGSLIMVCQTGSKAYGLDTPESDTDARGIFVPHVKYLLGLHKVEQIKISGDDFVCHDIRQFIHILIGQNPTIMEMLYTEPIFETPFWAEYAPKFRQLIHRKAFKSYSAYVRSQLYKAKNRKPIGKRSRIVEAVGFDTKFCSHVARLAVQCIYLMSEGYIPVKVPEPYRTDIMGIKTGEWSKEKAITYCEHLDETMHLAYLKSKLPESIDLEQFEKNIYVPMIKKIIDNKSYDLDWGKI